MFKNIEGGGCGVVGMDGVLIENCKTCNTGIMNPDAFDLDVISSDAITTKVGKKDYQKFENLVGSVRGVSRRIEIIGEILITLVQVSNEFFDGKLTIKADGLWNIRLGPVGESENVLEVGKRITLEDAFDAIVKYFPKYVETIHGKQSSDLKLPSD